MPTVGWSRTCRPGCPGSSADRMRRIPVRPLLAAAIALSLAGCGSGSPEHTEPTSTSPTAEHGALAHCLAEHGVTGPNGAAVGPPMGPAAPPAGVDPGTWERAMQACGSLEPGPAGP